MRRIIFSLVFASFGFSSLAQASQPLESPANSRGFQLAKRVAAMENSKDLPSRAIWLSQRVVKNSRDLAYHQPQKAKKQKTKKH